MSDEPACGDKRKPSRAQLRKRLRVLAQRFADDVVTLLDDCGFWDEVEPPPQQPPLPRRVRRSDATLEAVASRIEHELRTRPGAAAISEIAAALALDARELGHPVNRLLQQARIERVGQKRGARYRIVSKTNTKSRRRRRARKSTTRGR